MRFFFVNRFYAPDLSATSQILTDVTESLAQDGFKISVICSRMSYSGDGIPIKEEELNGVQVIRVYSTKFGRKSNIGRAFDYLTFYISVMLCLLSRLSKRDVVVAKTDPPMLSIPLGAISRMRRAHLVNWLQDIFPEIAQKLGMLPSGGGVARILVGLRNRSLRRASANVAIGIRMAEQVEQFGVAGRKIHVIENFVDDIAIHRRSDHSSNLRKEWGLEPHDFVVGYSGNLGRAHDLDTILDAAMELQVDPMIKFLFVGGGYLHEKLLVEKENRGLNNIVLRAYQPREKLPESLALPNIHWASLNPKLEGYILPSKVYGIAAAGRPLLMIGDTQGEIGTILFDHNFGVCAKPGDAKSAKTFILDLKSNPEKAETLGRNARHYIDGESSKSHALAKWRDLFSHVAKGS